VGGLIEAGGGGGRPENEGTDAEAWSAGEEKLEQSEKRQEGKGEKSVRMEPEEVHGGPEIKN
jgi:hypothetical protein